LSYRSGRVHGTGGRWQNDAGKGADALLSLTAAAGGTYYLVAAANNDAGTGTYHLDVLNG
jgi:hypothetical protein